jgi:hypothetical protein
MPIWIDQLCDTPEFNKEKYAEKIQEVVSDSKATGYMVYGLQNLSEGVSTATKVEYV